MMEKNGEHSPSSSRTSEASVRHSVLLLASYCLALRMTAASFLSSSCSLILSCSTLEASAVGAPNFLMSGSLLSYRDWSGKTIGDCIKYQSNSSGGEQSSCMQVRRHGSQGVLNAAQRLQCKDHKQRGHTHLRLDLEASCCTEASHRKQTPRRCIVIVANLVKQHTARRGWRQ